MNVTAVEFTLTASDPTRASDTDPIGFTIGATGSVDLTVGSDPAITDLALSGVTATATSDGITLTANATIPQAQATLAIAAFSSSPPAVSADVPVVIELIVTDINPVASP